MNTNEKVHFYCIQGFMRSMDPVRMITILREAIKDPKITEINKETARNSIMELQQSLINA